MYKPNYIISDELLNKIAQIEALRLQIDSSYILPEREVEMRYRASVEATHSSTSIEGNPLNRKQVERILSSSESLTRHQYAEIEVRNYKKALDFINQRKEQNVNITTKDILAIHKFITNNLLPLSKVGAWRKNPVYIADQSDLPIYTAPPAATVLKETQKLLDWLNERSRDIHPVIAAAILHFQFVSIHPFADGNGRTTRILTSLYLGLRNYDMRGSLVLDTYYNTDKLGYYQALQNQGKDYHARTDSEADLTPWINYFAEGFLSSTKVLAVEVALLANYVENLPQKPRISLQEADLLSYIQQFGSITLSEAEGVLRGVPRRTIQRRLKSLVDAGYIITRGTSSDRIYLKPYLANQL
jgi:Fic family protein